MTAFEASVLLAAALAAGAVNSVAGGGSFITLPTLVLFNVPPVAANATSAVAAWPGLLSGAWAYRGRLRAYGVLAVAFALASLAGGLLGGALVLLTPAEDFAVAMPFLMAFGTLLFVLGPKLGRLLGREAEWRPRRPRDLLNWRLPVQFLVGLMGGYFNAGGGILSMAALSAFGIRDIQVINGFKTMLGVVVTSASVLTFVLAGQVSWPQAAVMTAGTIVGGRLGARFAQSLSGRALHALISVFSIAMTIWFFHRFAG